MMLTRVFFRIGSGYSGYCRTTCDINLSSGLSTRNDHANNMKILVLIHLLLFPYQVVSDRYYFVRGIDER